MQNETYPAVWTHYIPPTPCRRAICASKILQLRQELAERIAAGHTATVLAADILIIGTGGVFALVTTNEIVAFV